MKGQWKTVESIMAGMVILLFVALLISTSVQFTPSVQTQGYKSLNILYDRGTLRAYAADMNTTAINSDIDTTGYLFGLNHSVTICNASTCIGSVPDSENIWASNLLISGDEQYEPVEVILYIFTE
ncbi:MAG: hypothetical protein JSV63_00480 [Candidatus Aenigmatarchaeota archaeon]|nr:MAG: hypothetical protein JSV63_00480 [Candidatus Aenigmarchaeota archaeon]